jgi:hypothetical protein
MNAFETETMAELCLKQGLVEEALAMYRRLVAGAPDAAARARRAARVAELEARAGAAPTPPSAAGAALGADAPALALERRGDALVFSWALPSDTATPALQLLLLRRGPDGVEAETRTLPLAAARGTTIVTVPALHSLRAAAGWLDGARFVPLARLPASGP